MKTEYKVVWNTYDCFERDVEFALEEGWRLVGGLCTWKPWRDKMRLGQAMAREVASEVIHEDGFISGYDYADVVRREEVRTKSSGQLSHLHPSQGAR